jgi:hypothetical protein
MDGTRTDMGMAVSLSGDERDGDHPMEYRKQAIWTACACWLMLLLLLLPILYSTNIEMCD